MDNIKFTDTEKALITPKIQRYLKDELDVECGSFDAEFLLDFFSTQIGAHYYNRGLNDALATMNQQLDNISDAIYQLEKPVE